MSDVIFPTEIPNGTPAADDRILLSDTSDSGAAFDAALSDLPVSTPTQTALNAKEDKSNKGIANGYAPLDATGKVPVANLPSSGSGDVTQASNSGSSGRLKVSAGADKSIQDYATSGIVKSDANGVVSAAVAGTDYLAPNSAITGATKTKITYDSKGLVTAGSDATTADVADSTNKRYVTDSQLVVLGNTSGTNTGNETASSIGSLINGASAATPNNTDLVATAVSAGSLVKITWTNVKAFLKTYFDTLYLGITATAANSTKVGGITISGTPTTGQVPTATSGTSATWQTPASGGGPQQIRIRIPGELVADTSNYQGVFWYNDTGATVTVSNVGFFVGLAAQGTGAAAAFNVYKSSGTSTDGINASAVNLFTSAVDLTTNYASATNSPNTATVEAGRWVSLRCTSSAGATRKASDAEVVITYS